MKKTNENGITLIALVVTIVVLLILAGITITYVMADGGIFDSAKQAASATIEAQILDYASQIQATFMTQSTVKTATGVTPATGDKIVNLVDEDGISDDDAKLFFPESLGYTNVTVSDLKEDTAAEGTITGGLTVDYNGTTYTITFTKGSPKITDRADAA